MSGSINERIMEHYCILQGYFPIGSNGEYHCNRENSSCPYADKNDLGLVRFFDFHDQLTKEYYLPKCKKSPKDLNS